MRRFTVMGFTEAELGFVIAAVFAAIAVVTLSDRDAYAAKSTIQAKAADERDDLRRQLEEQRMELERIKAERDALLKKQSTKIPQCWEKGRQREPIGEVVIAGDNQYVLEGNLVGIDDVRTRFSSHIDDGLKLGCRYVLRAIPEQGVDAVSHSRAVLRLRPFFDVSDRPR